MSNIVELVGEEDFKKLQREFGGTRIWIPKMGNVGTRDRRYYLTRNELIIKMRQKGFSVENIATRFGVSSKRVYNILACDTDEN